MCLFHKHNFVFHHVTQVWDTILPKEEWRCIFNFKVEVSEKEVVDRISIFICNKCGKVIRVSDKYGKLKDGENCFR